MAPVPGSRPHARGVTVADWHRRGRHGRRGPWNAGEVEEVQKIWLGSVAVRQVLLVADKPVFDELDHRRMVHGYV